MKKKYTHHHKKGHHHSEMLSQIDLYAYHSGIGHWNPHVKVGLSLAFLLICIIADNLYVSAGVLLMTAYVTLMLGKLPFKQYIHLLTLPITFMVLGSIAIVLNFSKTPKGLYYLPLSSFYLYVTKEGLMKILHLWGKALGALSAMYMMSLSTPSNELFSVLRKWKVPALLIELMNMIYRFIFVMMDTFRKMKNSAQSRLGYCDYKTAIHTFGNIASNLLVVSMKKASHYYDAMESRCYDGELRFLEMEKKIDRSQILHASAMIAILVAVWIISSGRR